VGALSSSRRTCGAEALRFCLLASGRSTPTLAEIQKQMPLGYEGVSAADMAELCRSLGVPARGVRTTLTELARAPTPSILHVDDSHFIVLVGLEGDRVVLFDNTIGLFDCTRDWFRQYYKWRGDALVLGPRTEPLWFFLRSPWSVLLSAGVFLSGCGLYFLLVRAPRPAGRQTAPA
jgi:ABC-type bacteriocin/lantibiotic exporter with double-glycine peptidase domain